MALTDEEWNNLNERLLPVLKEMQRSRRPLKIVIFVFMLISLFLIVAIILKYVWRLYVDVPLDIETRVIFFVFTSMVFSSALFVYYFLMQGCDDAMQQFRCSIALCHEKGMYESLPLLSCYMKASETALNVLKNVNPRANPDE